MTVATTGVSLTLLTVNVYVSLTEAVPSVAVTVTFIAPTSALAGVPLSSPVFVSMLNHVGNAEPSSKSAL